MVKELNFPAGKILKEFLLLVSIFFCCASYSAVTTYSIYYGKSKIGTVVTWPDKTSFSQKFHFFVQEEDRLDIIDQCLASKYRLPGLMKYIGFRDKVSIDSLYELEVESKRVCTKNGHFDYSVVPLKCSSFLKVMLSSNEKRDKSCIKLLELFSFSMGRNLYKPGNKYEVYDPDLLGGFFRVEILKISNQLANEGRVVSWKGESLDSKEIMVFGEFEYINGQNGSEKLKYSMPGWKEVVFVKESFQLQEQPQDLTSDSSFLLPSFNASGLSHSLPPPTLEEDRNNNTSVESGYGSFGSSIHHMRYPIMKNKK